MPYICLAQNLPDGTVQILDLKPNSSQRNTIYEPPGQTKYVNRALNGTLVYTTAGVTMGSVAGLSAYLVDRVAPVGGSGSWTALDQLTVSQTLINAVDAGNPLTAAAVDVIIQGQFPGTSLAGAPSTGVLTELLSILAGREYVLGPGFTKGTGGVWDAVQRGSFTEPVVVADPDLNPPIGGLTVQYENKPIIHTVHSSAFAISLAVGDLAALVLLVFFTYPSKYFITLFINDI